MGFDARKFTHSDRGHAGLMLAQDTRRRGMSNANRSSDVLFRFSEFGRCRLVVIVLSHGLHGSIFSELGGQIGREASDAPELCLSYFVVWESDCAEDVATWSDLSHLSEGGDEAGDF